MHVRHIGLVVLERDSNEGVYETIYLLIVCVHSMAIARVFNYHPHSRRLLVSKTVL
jgi:hypothetical protein